MTRDEKFTAIVDRLNTKSIEIDSETISSLSLAGYTDDLAVAGIIESGFDVTQKGKDVRAICEEFDWKPDDTDIIEFVKEIVGPKEQAAFVYLLKKYRDDREGLINDFKSVKDRAEQA